MGEFAGMNRRRAAHLLREMFQQEVTPETDPILELIGRLLEDGSGGVNSPRYLPVTTEEWLTWNRLALERPTELAKTVGEVLEAEFLEIPTNREALPAWAAHLLACTLERMGTM